jgi:uncharacterized protein
MTATLDRITIYPIKSLDGIDVESAVILPSGGLEHDRRFALIDADGRYVTGKRAAAIHRIRAKYDLTQMTVQFNDRAQFSLLQEPTEIAQYLSSALGIACGLAENTTGGFPDDTDLPGPTLLSTATLTEVAAWFPRLAQFPGLTLDEVRRRFRANLEIGGVEPFWEDRLVGPAATPVAFRIGKSEWLGMNPCQRCVVPTRDSATGDAIPGFQKTFALAREQHLPTWAPRDRFNHFYRLSVNTLPAPLSCTKLLHIGDRVEIDGLPGVQTA